MVDGEIVGLIAQALAATIGVKLQVADALASDKLRQRIMRQLQRLGDARPPVSVLTRKTPSGIHWVFLVKSEFMKGKSLDAESARKCLAGSPDQTGPRGPV